MILTENEVLIKVHEQLRVVYFALLWSLLAIALAWNQGWLKSVPLLKNSAINGFKVLIGFGLFIFSQVFLLPNLFVVIYYFFTGNLIHLKDLTPSLQFWMTIAITVGGYVPLLLYYIFFFSKEQKLDLFGDASKKWYKSYLFGASTWFLAFPLILFWSQLIDISIMVYFRQSPIDQLPVEQVKLAMSHPLRMIVMSLTIAGIVPVAEEFLFRGLLQSWIKRKCGSPVIGIVTASVIFALFHFSFSQDLSNIQFLSSIFLLSCFLGYLYERKRTLWASIGLHSVFNAVSILFVVLENWLKV